MSRKRLSRRQFVAASALSSAALITAPFVRSAHAAGKLAIGFWDHWVPGANKACADLVNEWAAKENVEVTIDFITSQGNKISLRCRHGGPTRIPTCWSPSTTLWSR
jgi:spermidine/putrescine-binding protein